MLRVFEGRVRLNISVRPLTVGWGYSLIQDTFSPQFALSCVILRESIIQILSENGVCKEIPHKVCEIAPALVEADKIS